MSRRFHGIGVSPGIAIGRVYLLHAEPLPVVPDPIPPERVEDELSRFAQARELARGELEELKRRVRETLGDHYAGILDAQLLILDDRELIERTRGRIRVGRVSARWALKQVVEEFDRKFAEMDEAYLSEKGGDLADVHLRLQRLLRGAVRHRDIPDGPRIVVAHGLGPSDAADLARRGVAGLATDVGGRTSHTAILAQALGVPAVAGLRLASQHATPGETVVLDGERGELLLDPTDEQRAAAMARRMSWLDDEAQAARDRAVPVRTRDGVEIAIRANIEFPSETDNVRRFGAQGVGLYRSEFLFLSHAPELPGEDDHYRTYRDLARAVAPHPAVIRTLDLGGEKYFHEVLQHEEGNPVLGLRAVRFCLERPEIFRPQLRGLLRAAVEPNLKIMLPLVTSVEEVRQVRALIGAEAAELTARGVPARSDVPVGVMIEVPAAALAADLIVPHADFISIGTNDLIQYALAVDRGNELVNYLYQPDHPGVLRMLRFVIDEAGRAGVPVAVCGEMATDPRSLAWLIGLGLREVSMQPRSIGRAREMVSEIDSAEAEAFARRLSRDGATDDADRPFETAKPSGEP
ncbi:MAG TPA: phosphoenolpyruvate--protein phosphotransferase [Candidatus Polarisedimenticolaceae bacterium]|nr:phosphoenolpyruvate--protein phosphotransferase [Candidatus Polarisedimenticolaceae bacterium]